MSLDFLSIILVLSFISWIWFQFKRSNNKLPPGPYPWPVVGNLLQLGKNPNQSLAKLSKTYGGLMHLKLGTVHTIVVSSPDIAREVMQKHDRAFSGRAVPHVAQALDHAKWSLPWAPVGTMWRRYRKICREEMFSTSRIVSTEHLRVEKVTQLREYLTECCVKNRVVNIGEVAFVTSVNLMWNTLFSVDFVSFDSDSSQEMRQLVHGLMKILGSPNISDYFPVLRRFDPQGISFEAEVYTRRFFLVFDDMVSKRLQSSSTFPKQKDLLDALIGIAQDNDIELSHNDIKHLLLDLLLGGTDTTTVTVEWVMTELFRNPEKLSKAKDELKAVIRDDKQVEESDIPRLSYLNAVLKETLRLHPPGPFLLPHKAISDVEINGYTIPKDATILVNEWAIGRDSRVWAGPERFEPERFLEGKIDYRGNNFELIPFGSGRRMCPGLPLAHVMVHLMVGSLIHHFDWRIDDGEMRSKSLDVSETFGLTASKAMPLMAYATK